MIQGVEIFKLLPEDGQKTLAEIVDVKDLCAGETLFHAGDPGDEMYIVHTGDIEIYIRDTAGQKIVVSVPQQGKWFGEIALLDRAPRTATAVALTDAQLLVLDRDDLEFIFTKNPHIALHLLAAMSGMMRQADALLRQRVARNANEEVAITSTPIQKVADALAWFSGSMLFLIIHIAWFAVWLGLNLMLPEALRFDPFPFGFLTLVVSLEAIFLSCFVLISSNRQAEKDKVRADIEYDVNIKAELEIAHLHDKTDRIYEQMLEKFVRLERLIHSK
jgi:uncharacterized membrane protein